MVTKLRSGQEMVNKNQRGKIHDVVPVIQHVVENPKAKPTTYAIGIWGKPAILSDTCYPTHYTCLLFGGKSSNGQNLYTGNQAVLAEG